MLNRLPLVSILLLAACADLVSAKEVNADDRFGLIPFNMPQLLVPDAEKCISITNAVKNETVSGGAMAQKAFDLGNDFWIALDGIYFDRKSDLEVLPNGGAVDSVASIFPKGASTLADKSEACGKIAGGVNVEIGLMSLSSSLVMAEAASPGVFEELGLDISEVQAGVKIIDAQAENLSDISVENIISCAALFQANQYSDEKFEPYSTIWMAALVKSIDGGEVSSQEIKSKSIYWSVLVRDGLEGLSSVEGVDQKNQQCSDWLDNAILKQAANK